MSIFENAPSSRTRSLRRRALRLLVAGALGLGTLPLLTSTASAASYTNPSPIVVPSSGMPPGCPFPDGCPATTAELYPSPIEVVGETGDLSSVTVTLHDLTASAPGDLDVMVVAPDGTAVMVMSDACGNNAVLNPITSPITLIFDNPAATALPADAPCTSGTFQPVDDDDDSEFSFTPVDSFPGVPAPASASLSSFVGGDPNGSWRLYVVDDFPDAASPTPAAQLATGWSLTVATQPGSTTTSTPSSTSTTLAPPGGPIEIDDTAPGDPTIVRVSGNVTCDQGSRFRVELTITQGTSQGAGAVGGTCTGSPQPFRSNLPTTAGPGFEDGSATVDATAQVGVVGTRAIEDSFSTSEAVDVDVR